MIDNFKDEYRFLSNFWLVNVVIAGEVFRSVEHAYMAMKTLDLNQRKQIKEAQTPAEAKRLGRMVTLRPDWEEVKLDIMYQLVSYKFTHYPALTKALLDTGTQELVEGNTWGDRFWGVCNGEGHNHLGKILMRVRDELTVGYRPNNFIIAGGRDFNNFELMVECVQELEKLGLVHQQTHLLCGMARGADMLGHRLFKAAGLNIREMPAEWELLGKRAGFARNEAMGAMADLALCFWDGQSRGTEHMIKIMDKLNKPVYVVRYS